MSISFTYFAATQKQGAGVLQDGPEGAGLTRAELKNIDPLIVLGGLYKLITGADSDADSGASLMDELEATLYLDGDQPAGGESFPQEVRPEWTAALAGIVDDQVGSLAARWSQAGVLPLDTDPEYLADDLRELRTVAIAASRPSHGMYVWMPME